MAYTQADIDAMKSAMKSGVSRVRFADRDVTYRSLAEMQAVLRVMEMEVNGVPPGPRFSQASFSEPFGT